MNVVDAISDPHLLEPWFRGPSWSAWKAMLRGAFGMALTPDELAVFRDLAARDPPRKRVKELWVVASRRAGKDSIASAIAAWAAAGTDYRSSLRPGEVASCLMLACDRHQARIVAQYARGYFRNNEMLGKLVTNETANMIALSTGAELTIATNSFRGLRGRSIACVILDEVAYWRSEESANPDQEVYQAIVPGLVTLPDSMLIGISSPYKRSGLLFEKWRAHFGKDDDRILVVNAPSRALNPTLKLEEIEAYRELDPEAAKSEWDGEFRSDLQNFVSREAVDACVTEGLYEIAPLPGVEYRAFVDPSGGSGLDSMTLAISHCESNGVAVLDAVRERKPQFSPDDCVEEFVQLLRSYRVTEIVGDKWGGGFTVEAFTKRGVAYQVSTRNKSELYREFLSLLNSRRVELLDHQKTIVQLLSLERKTARGGRDSIDHPAGPSFHDDLINAAAGSLVISSGIGSDEFSVREFVAAWGNASTLAEYDRKRATRLN